MKNKKYFLSNIETGTSEEVSQKQYNSYYNAIKSAKCKINPSYKGKVIIISTGGKGYE